MPRFIKGRTFKLFRRWPKQTLWELFVGLAIIIFLFLLTIIPGWIAPYNPLTLFPAMLQPPNREHLCGTDTLGRDILSRMIYGARPSLLVAFAAVALSFFIGVPLGCISAYSGGKLDRVASIVMDAFWGIPTIILALLIVTMIGPNIFNLALAIGIAASPSYFRVVRSVTLSLKEIEFIEAERSLGASSKRIVFRHILPIAMPSVLVLMTLNVAHSVIAIAALGFLGVGLPPPTPEWGTDINIGRYVLLSGIWWPTVFYGLMIFLTVLGFTLFGEGLKVVITPRFKVR